MTIPEFTESERRLVAQCLAERYGNAVATEDVDVEMELVAGAPPVECPALYWTQRGAEFVVAKTGVAKFRTQFFYANGEQFGTGRVDYDNLGDCVVSVLQVQSDDERRRAGMGSGSKAPAAPDDYDGPIVI